MFVVTFVLFLLPIAILLAAWRSSVRAAREATPRDWRSYVNTTSLVVATCTTFLELLFFMSWFHHGGSPHGMTPSVGLWAFLRKFVVYVFVASIFLSAFGKGKCRLLLFA